MGIGNYNKQVVVQKNTLSSATTGGQSDSWATLVTTWGMLKKKAGARVLVGYDVTVDDDWELWLNYQSAIENNLSTKTLRFKIDNRYFTIQSFEKIGERNFKYKFIVAEHRG